jgi:hypothetical protein
MNTNITLASASSILPCWNGKYITSFIAAVESGLQAERKRLGGNPYVVVASRHQYDYDGLTQYVDLVEAFPSQELALAFAHQASKTALVKALDMPTYGSYKWHQVDGWSEYFNRCKQPQVHVIGSERLHLENGSGFDLIYIEHLILHIQASEPLGNELFAYLGDEYEVMRYLSMRSEPRSTAGA